MSRIASRSDLLERLMRKGAEGTGPVVLAAEKTK